MDRSAERRGWIIDPHVHLYGGFAADRFLEAAVRNLGRAAGRLGCADGSALCVLLMDTAGRRGFDRIGGELPGTWALEPAREPHSMILRCPGELPLAVVAGRQVATAERLELLVFPAPDELPDGEPIDRSIARARSAGATVLLPWGVGKWMFTRGRTVDRILSERPIPVVDNGGRPRWLPTPPSIRRARARGVAVLPGSDPLPLPAQVGRTGRSGALIRCVPDLERPAAQLGDLLGPGLAQPATFCRNEPLLRFLLSQAAMQLPPAWRAAWADGRAA